MEFDGLLSRFFLGQSKFMIFVLQRIFNSFLIHNYIPADMLEGVIIPLVKDKKGDVRSTNNYLEVMISNNIYKIFEYCLLPYINDVKLSHSQFGYRKNTSTLLAVSCLKETIRNNIDNKDSVCSCFLDMSKDFERICHGILLNKLVVKELPSLIVNMFAHIFNNTEVCVKCHQLVVNANKTMIVVFNRQSRDFTFLFKNTVLDLLDNIKYLGCMLNFKLCDDLDIDRCNVSFNRSLFFFYLGSLIQ